jgi:hypothetical protein
MDGRDQSGTYRSIYLPHCTPGGTCSFTDLKKPQKQETPLNPTELGFCQTEALILDKQKGLQ